MRIALFIIILFLGQLIHELNIIPDFWLGFLTGIGWSGLLYGYFKSKKK